MGRWLLVAFAVLLSGCTGSDGERFSGGSDSKPFTQRGVSVVLPQGWSAIGKGWTESVTPTRVGFASFATSRDLEGDCQSANIVNEMPADGVVLFLIDYGGDDPGEAETFARRPGRLSTEGHDLIAFGCFGTSYVWRFRAGGRFLQAHLAPGTHARAERIDDALTILNSLDVGPS